MPIHDWTRVDRWLFHSFSLEWVSRLSSQLNGGVLPSAYYALCETLREGRPPSFLELAEPAFAFKDPGDPGQSRFRLESPPQTSLRAPCISPEYAEQIVGIRRCDDHSVVAALRIVTRDAKCRPYRFTSFVGWAVEVIRSGVSLLIVDLFPTEPGGAQDIAKALWDEFVVEEFNRRPDKPLSLVTYSAGLENTAYIEPVAVGDVLPDMPLFLKPEVYVPAPLEATYQTTWNVFPGALKGLLEPPDAKS